MTKIIKFFTNNLFAYVFLVLMLIIMSFLLIKNAHDDSATTDEPIHILTGYEYWKGVFTVNPEHPPLGKQLAAIPLNFIVKPLLPVDQKFTSAINNFYYDSWVETKSYAQNWLYNTFGNNPDEIVFAARMIVALATILLGIIIFFVSYKWYGKTTSLISIFLFSLSPIFLTHGHLANTDVWMTLGYFSAVFSFAWYLENPKLYKMLLAAIIFSIALLLKFSAVLLIPVFVLLWLVKFHTSNKDNKYSWKKFIEVTFVFLVISLFIIWADYGFPMNFAPRSELNSVYSYTNKPLQILAPVLQHLPMPLYFKGLIMVFSSSLANRTAFILGHFFSGGVWYYFIIAFLVKEPLSLIILLFSGIFYWIFRKRKLEFHDWVLIIPVSVYLLASLASKLNIGIRHLLPIYPFIFIFIGYFVSELYEKYKNASKQKFLIFNFIILILFVWYLFANISIYPYYMTYFNELAGGPKNGVKLLSDSNIDWGQDMKRLANWLKEQNITEPIKMEYFWSGYLQPKYYGINFTTLEQNSPLQKGWIAVGASALQGQEFYWLNNYQPIQIIGNSIYVYKID